MLKNPANPGEYRFRQGDPKKRGRQETKRKKEGEIVIRSLYTSALDPHMSNGTGPSITHSHTLHPPPLLAEVRVLEGAEASLQVRRCAHQFAFAEMTWQRSVYPF